MGTDSLCCDRVTEVLASHRALVPFQESWSKQDRSRRLTDRTQPGQEAVALQSQLEEQQDVPGHPKWQELPVQLAQPYLQRLQRDGALAPTPSGAAGIHLEPRL